MRSLCFLLFIVSEAFSQGTVPEGARAFSGWDKETFPIVANGLIRTIRNADKTEEIAKDETIARFVDKVSDAGFSVLMVNGNRFNLEGKQGAYYASVLQEVKRRNERDPENLRLLIYEDGFLGGFPFLTLKSLQEKYDSATTYGFFVDEPDESRFSRLRQWMELFRRKELSSWVQTKLLYVNLFGCHVYGNRYERYVRSWIAAAKPPVLSFDNYSVWDDVHAKKYGLDIGADWTRDYFVNLEMFRRLSVQEHVPFWTWIMVHRHWSLYSKRFYRRATPADLRLQVYAALAYGAKGLLYYNFWNPPEAIENPWHEERGIIEGDAAETELFAAAQSINTKVKIVGKTLLKLTSEGVRHASNSLWCDAEKKYVENWDPLFDQAGDRVETQYGIQLAGIDSSQMFRSDTGSLCLVTGMNNRNGLVGQLFNSATGDRYFMVVNKNRHEEQQIDFEIQVTRKDALNKAYLRNVCTDAKIDGECNISRNRINFICRLDSGDGILFKLITH